MKKIAIALGTTLLLTGAALAQSPTSSAQEFNKTTVPAEAAKPMTTMDAPPAGVSPTASQQTQDATTAAPRTTPVAPPAPSATNRVSPTSSQQTQDATTAPVR